ncbi:hypothetical protein [Enterovibrio norvegicus]|nr:hypothetical protein [Enterovibrio norvegicus]
MQTDCWLHGIAVCSILLFVQYWCLHSTDSAQRGFSKAEETLRE